MFGPGRHPCGAIIESMANRSEPPRLTTTTMRGCFEGGPEMALNALLSGQPWFTPDPTTPACGAVAYVPPGHTNDATERMFCCDRPVHPPTEKHRQVIDVDEGRTIEWADPSGPA